MNSTTDTLRALLAVCEAEARKQGWIGEWEALETDLEWICDVFGRKPSREEWTDVGIPGIGGANVEPVR